MKKKFIALLLCAAVALTFAACGAKPVATVNGVEISQDEYDEYTNYMVAYYSQMYSSYGMEFSMTDQMAESMQTDTIDQLILMEEVKQACEKNDCAPTDEELEAYIYEALGATDKASYSEAMASIKESYGMSEETISKVIGSSLYQENLSDYLAKEQGLKVSKKKAQAQYEEDPDSYDNITVSHILISPVVAEGEEAQTDEDGNPVYTDEQWAAAKAKAEDLIAQLNEGADFAELATENSDDTNSAENGGALGDAIVKNSTSYDENFLAGAFALTGVDEYTKTPVKSAYGYHIILCTGIENADQNFDDLIKSIRQTKLNELKEEAFNTYMETYKEECDVEIYYGTNATVDENGEAIKEEAAETDASEVTAEDNTTSDSELTEEDAETEE